MNKPGVWDRETIHCQSNTHWTKSSRVRVQLGATTLYTAIHVGTYHDTIQVLAKYVAKITAVLVADHGLKLTRPGTRGEQNEGKYIK